MDAVKFLKTKSKMTQNCEIGCEKCEFSSYKNGIGILCNNFMNEYPEEAVKLVEEWLKQYEISYKDVFFKQHPNAHKYENGDPQTCRKLIYGGECPAHDDCHKCWNEIKEDE